MKVLKVPYAEKDEAKALGARWNPTRKSWYVPDGVAVEPFAKWLAGSAAAGASAGEPSSRDARAAKPVVGSKYVELAHACNPFEECAECRPKLIDSGWFEAHQTVRKMLAAL
ncbi:DUF5710 domain-containing protein [Massilia sp. YIM B02769]|uniref:DUF5710 domain-containing protein n=1 Tax=Massilia sp. YIM B02769 TaxID=3050129 RepID=UPI0025B6E6DD|nr:DUF5710 domain-containing protein [Massilia sp. YIM B02769]MDN4058379.1 DUF5710 domain-containing protein [Massilia sp. YIM B02769]